jgi:hypothetical protein
MDCTQHLNENIVAFDTIEEGEGFKVSYDGDFFMRTASTPIANAVNLRTGELFIVCSDASVYAAKTARVNYAV